MFGYQPTVNDNSGAIMAQGMMGAADTQANAMAGLGQNIGNALTTLAAAYGQRQGTIAKGKNFKKFMGMAGSAFGIDDDKLGMFNEMEDFDAGIMLDNFGSWMPAMANAQLGRDRMGVTQQGQQIQQALPGLRNQADAAARAASGEGQIQGAVWQRK